MSHRFHKAYAGIQQERTSPPETVVANNGLNDFTNQAQAQPARQVQADEQPAIAPNRTNNVNTSRFGKHDKNATDALQHTI
ncbi:hypothetical protein Tco_1232009, partial [Tanacetum coccineum]